MKKNIIISAILALVMMMSILPMSAFATEGTPDFVDTATNTITIKNPTDMRWLSTYDGSITGLPATFAGWTINIVGEIDLNNELWTPIPDFRGTMKGVEGTSVIKNLKVDITTEGAGLCAKSGGGAKFEGLTIVDSDIKTTQRFAGAFIGNGFTSTFVNCHTFNTDVYGERFVGGIVGFNYGSITNCTVKANDNETVISAKLNVSVMSSSGDNVGGIVGQIGEGNYTISGCVVDGVQVKASRQAGGIAGLALYRNIITGCKVYNTAISVTASFDFPVSGSSYSRTASVGGIVGQIQPSAGTVIKITGNTVGSGTTISRTNGSTSYCGWVLGDVTRAGNNTGLYDVADNICEITTSLDEIGN